VFVQGTLNVPEGTVSVIVRPFEGRYRDDFVFIPLLFTEITPQVVDEAKEKYFATGTRTTDEKLNVLFIGNSSAKIDFTDADWDAISRFVNSTWERDGSRWLITSSYRTGGKLEQRIRSGLRPEAVFDAVWYSEAPRKVTKEFLGMAARVFVTMDSLTMLTEGASSGRPTFALCPEIPPEADANTHVRYIHQLAGQGYIALVSVSGEWRPLDFEPRKLDGEYAEAIHQLQKKIGWIT
jgi:mitochondrial fission protein ELM1